MCGGQRRARQIVLTRPRCVRNLRDRHLRSSVHDDNRQPTLKLLALIELANRYDVQIARTCLAVAPHVENGLTDLARLEVKLDHWLPVGGDGIRQTPGARTKTQGWSSYASGRGH
jgi:hypothetical protein